MLGKPEKKAAKEKKQKSANEVIVEVGGVPEADKPKFISALKDLLKKYGADLRSPHGQELPDSSPSPSPATSP